MVVGKAHTDHLEKIVVCSDIVSHNHGLRCCKLQLFLQRIDLSEILDRIQPDSLIVLQHLYICSDDFEQSSCKSSNVFPSDYGILVRHNVLYFINKQFVSVGRRELLDERFEPNACRQLCRFESGEFGSLAINVDSGNV